MKKSLLMVVITVAGMLTVPQSAWSQIVVAGQNVTTIVVDGTSTNPNVSEVASATAGATVKIYAAQKPGMVARLKLTRLPDNYGQGESANEQGGGDDVTQVGQEASLKAVEDNAETLALRSMIEEATQNGDFMSVLPDDIKAQIPEGVTDVLGLLTLTLTGYYDKMGGIEIRIPPVEPYPWIDKVFVVFALPDGHGGYEWSLRPGERQSDNTIIIILSANVAKRLANNTFVCMILER